MKRAPKLVGYKTSFFNLDDDTVWLLSKRLYRWLCSSPVVFWWTRVQLLKLTGCVYSFTGQRWVTASMCLSAAFRLFASQCLESAGATWGKVCPSTQRRHRTLQFYFLWSGGYLIYHFHPDELTHHELLQTWRQRSESCFILFFSPPTEASLDRSCSVLKPQQITQQYPNHTNTINLSAHSSVDEWKQIDFLWNCLNSCQTWVRRVLCCSYVAFFFLAENFDFNFQQQENSK